MPGQLKPGAPVGPRMDSSTLMLMEASTRTPLTVMQRLVAHIWHIGRRTRMVSGDTSQPFPAGGISLPAAPTNRKCVRKGKRLVRTRAAAVVPIGPPGQLALAVATSRNPTSFPFEADWPSIKRQANASALGSIVLGRGKVDHSWRPSLLQPSWHAGSGRPPTLARPTRGSLGPAVIRWSMQGGGDPSSIPSRTATDSEI